MIDSRNLPGLLRFAMVIAASALLSACGGVSLWPFGDSGPRPEAARAPADATAYQCEGGRRLYVRLLENGAAAWVILPDREFRLERVSPSLYRVGANTLELSGASASLSEGAVRTYSGCNRG
jgi:hypothetical protein